MTSTILNPNLYKTSVETAATRDGFGTGIVAAAELDDRVVALVADLTESTRLTEFQNRFFDRFFDVGVAEQNLVTVASGMAAAGKIPFTASYATFSPGRNWEQIRTTICYNDRPVIIVGSHAGLSVGPDGATHQALEDIALMRVLPNMCVIAPCDALEAHQATLALAKLGKPAYLRLARNDSPIITRPDTPFTIGKIQTMRTGRDVTIFGSGPILYQALLAAEHLKGKKISVEVLNVATIKPLDVEAIMRSARKTRAVVTVEEHQIVGGLGSAVAELLAERLPTPQEFIGVRDLYGESGTPEELWEKYHLMSSDIVQAVNRVLKRKQN